MCNVCTSPVYSSHSVSHRSRKASRQCKIEEKEGGGEDAKVQANTRDIRVEVMKDEEIRTAETDKSFLDTFSTYNQIDWRTGCGCPT